jgi:Zn-dependent peptidase ImmA (M78 family)
MNILDVIKDPKQLKIYNQYASSTPFDVISFAQDLGIEVLESDQLEKTTRGYIKEFSNNKVVICVNKNNYFNRKRFTIAHELGHYFLHRGKLKNTIIEAEDYQDNAMYHDETLNQEEKEANNFGATILMPKEQFIKLWNMDNYPVEMMAKDFLVSELAIYTRAKFLGLIGDFRMNCEW